MRHLCVQLSITLTNEMADIIRAKVAAGKHATESEVIRDGLRALLTRDRAFELWLHQQVTPAYDSYKATPSRARSAAQVRATLSAQRNTASTKRCCPISLSSRLKQKPSL